MTSSSTTTTPLPVVVTTTTSLSNFNWNVSTSTTAQPPHYSSLIGKSLQLDQRHTVSVEEVIAEGGFGVIFLVKATEHNKTKLALKRVVVNSERDYASVSREVAIMSTLSPRTPHILGSLAHAVICYGQTTTYEVQNLMPLCKHNLHQVATSRITKNSCFTEQEVLQVLNQVSLGLHHLHTSTPPIIHRDIKIENILVAQNEEGTDTYLLSDFGSATTSVWDPTVDSIQQIQEDLDHYTTLNYRSPEMVDLYGDKGVLGVASDIWALGVSGFKLMCFKDPFESILAIQNRNLNWSPKTKYSDNLVSLCECLLAEYQSVRPPVDEVIRITSSGLNGDWEGLLERASIIHADSKRREEEVACSKTTSREPIVLETTVTPRQRPKRGAANTGGSGAPNPPQIIPNNIASNVQLPPPLAPPKSPKPVSSPGDNNNVVVVPPPTVTPRFFSPAPPAPGGATTVLSASCSPVPANTTPSPQPAPAPPTHCSWNPFDEDYQPPPPPPHHYHHQYQPHCDNDSIQQDETQNQHENDDDDDDPFAKAPFDYFKYQPIMLQQQQQQGADHYSNVVLHQQQPYYAPNNPFLYDVQLDTASTNELLQGLTPDINSATNDNNLLGSSNSSLNNINNCINNRGAPPHGDE